jgi:hypothetical protein
MNKVLRTRWQWISWTWLEVFCNTNLSKMCQKPTKVSRVQNPHVALLEFIVMLIEVIYMTAPYRGHVRLVKLSRYYRCMSIWVLWRACLLRSRRHPFTDRAVALRGNIFFWRWKSDWTRHILSDIPLLGWPGCARGGRRRKWWNYPVVDWRSRNLPHSREITITSA